jgi:spoIIIJ-associated protein
VTVQDPEGEEIRAEPPAEPEETSSATELEAAEETRPEPDETSSATESEPTEESRPEPDETPSGTESEPVEDTRPEPDEVAAVAEEFLGGLVSAMNLEAEVTSRVEEETAYVDVEGEDLGVLIGRRGQTLDGVQEITRTAVQRRLRARVRLMVDVEGYRARRQESLAEYARSMARRAKERGTEIELEPMNAYERKIVHDAVAEVEGASSFSEGEEPYRKVIVRGM